MPLGDLARRSGAFCFCVFSLQWALANFGSVLWRVPGHVKHVHQVEMPVPVLVPVPVPVPFPSFFHRQVRAVPAIGVLADFFGPLAPLQQFSQ
jgi:hypothetical protein